MALKARAAENAARKLLERNGYVIHQAQAATVRRGKRTFTLSNDVFGVFDLLGLPTTDADVPLVLLIQVTTTGGVTQRRHKILDWLQDNNVLYDPTAADNYGLYLIEIWESRSRKDDLDPRRVVNYFRIHQYRQVKPGEAWPTYRSGDVPRDDA